METHPAHWVIVLHLGLEGCAWPRELWFVMYMYIHAPVSTADYTSRRLKYYSELYIFRRCNSDILQRIES